ncbi:MAG: hypothetical protein MZV63_28755 [Marinilabiliales bacterium]|nr:hypothetical protein [Marinilabiliales bacterium]
MRRPAAPATFLRRPHRLRPLRVVCPIWVAKKSPLPSRMRISPSITSGWTTARPKAGTMMRWPRSASG